MHSLCQVIAMQIPWLHPQQTPKLQRCSMSLLPLPLLPLMWQQLANLNQCESSNSLPFLSCGLLFRALSHGRWRKFHNFLQHGILPLKNLLFLDFLFIMWTSKHQCLVVLKCSYCAKSLPCRFQSNIQYKFQSHKVAPCHSCHSPYFLSCGNHLLI